MSVSAAPVTGRATRLWRVLEHYVTEAQWPGLPGRRLMIDEPAPAGIATDRRLDEAMTFAQSKAQAQAVTESSQPACSRSQAERSPRGQDMSPPTSPEANPLPNARIVLISSISELAGGPEPFARACASRADTASALRGNEWTRSRATRPRRKLPAPTRPRAIASDPPVPMRPVSTAGAGWPTVPPNLPQTLPTLKTLHSSYSPQPS